MSLTAEAILPKLVIDFLSYLTNILKRNKCRKKCRKTNVQNVDNGSIEEGDGQQKAKSDKQDKAAKLRDESRELLKLVINYL